MAVEQHPDVDVIVIGHTVVKDIETYLSQIREITKTARIVLLLNGKDISIYKSSMRDITDDIMLRILSLRVTV